MTDLPWWVLVPVAVVAWWFALVIIVNTVVRLLDVPVVGDVLAFIMTLLAAPFVLLAGLIWWAWPFKEEARRG